MLFLVSTFALNESGVKADSGSASQYFRMPVAEQIKQFGKRSLEDQYNLYLYGNQVVHPPAIYLARAFASQGPAIVPFLRGKLEVATEDLTVRDIALVFSELAFSGSYDFSKDEGLLDLLSRRVGDMQGPWRDTTLRIVDELRSGR